MIVAVFRAWNGGGGDVILATGAMGVELICGSFLACVLEGDHWGGPCIWGGIGGSLGVGDAFLTGIGGCEYFGGKRGVFFLDAVLFLLTALLFDLFVALLLFDLFVTLLLFVVFVLKDLFVLFVFAVVPLPLRCAFFLTDGEALLALAPFGVGEELRPRVFDEVGSPVEGGAPPGGGVVGRLICKCVTDAVTNSFTASQWITRFCDSASSFLY